ncbi:hypothetical protein pb186bvf_000517 [Paramecium bursaria]
MSDQFNEKADEQMIQEKEQVQEEKEEENQDEERFSSFSEGDQYGSDSDDVKFDIIKPEKKPFKQIGIDYQKIQPLVHLPPDQKDQQQDNEEQKKIEAYKLYQQKLLEQEELQRQIEEKLKEKDDQQIKDFQAKELQTQEGVVVNTDEIKNLIKPWEVNYDQTWKKNYYFNPITNESLWELPLDVVKKIQDYRRQYEHRLLDYEERNMYKFLPKTYIATQRQILFQKRQKYLKRPARKQVEESLATKYGYKQGDEEYNTWFDRFLSDGNKYKEKDAALTRMHPDIDSGYTKADLYEKFSTYFCLFFSRGCCAEGVNCRYYHRIPNLDECQTVDNSKDIFGRTRFANHREDMTGVGCFTRDTRAIYISHYKMPKADTSTQALALMYEMLWRHFSVFGDIDDLNVIPIKGVSFIRFKHRCQAEFAKESMDCQALDSQEVLMVKWAYEDPNPKAMSREVEEEKLKLVQAVKEKDKRQKQQQSMVRQKIDGKQVRDRSQNDRKKPFKKGGGGGRLFDND